MDLKLLKTVAVFSKVHIFHIFIFRSAHARACERGDQRLNNLKWPWERLFNFNNTVILILILCFRSAHARACERGDERLNNIKWPLERLDTVKS